MPQPLIALPEEFLPGTYLRWKCDNLRTGQRQLKNTGSKVYRMLFLTLICTRQNSGNKHVRRNHLTAEESESVILAKSTRHEPKKGLN